LRFSAKNHSSKRPFPPATRSRFPFYPCKNYLTSKTIFGIGITEIGGGDEGPEYLNLNPKGWGPKDEEESEGGDGVPRIEVQP